MPFMCFHRTGVTTKLHDLITTRVFEDKFLENIEVGLANMAYRQKGKLLKQFCLHVLFHRM